MSFIVDSSGVKRCAPTRCFGLRDRALWEGPSVVRLLPLDRRIAVQWRTRYASVVLALGKFLLFVHFHPELCTSTMRLSARRRPRRGNDVGA